LHVLFIKSQSAHGKDKNLQFQPHPAEERTLESTKKDLLKVFQKKDETNKNKIL